MRITTKGVCSFCKGIISKRSIIKHLNTCKSKEIFCETTLRKVSNCAISYQLLVLGKYEPYYWLHLEIPDNMTLHDLDEFLRHIWLECCGHLSRFTIEGNFYSVDLPEEEAVIQPILNVLGGSVPSEESMDVLV